MGSPIMADYSDVQLESTPVAITPALEDTIIYASGGTLRFSSHANPVGNTVGIPLNAGEAHLVKSGTELTAWSDTGAPVTLVRITA